MKKKKKKLDGTMKTLEKLKDFGSRFWRKKSLIYVQNFPRLTQILLTFVILCENIRF